MKRVKRCLGLVLAVMVLASNMTALNVKANTLDETPIPIEEVISTLVDTSDTSTESVQAEDSQKQDEVTTDINKEVVADSNTDKVQESKDEKKEEVPSNSSEIKKEEITSDKQDETQAKAEGNESLTENNSAPSTNVATSSNSENSKNTSVNTKVNKITKEYLQGIYTSEEAVNFRKEIVVKYNLQDKVDSDLFFKEEYLNALIDDTTIGDKIVLVKLSKKGSSLDGIVEMTNSERSTIIQNIISEVENENSSSSSISITEKTSTTEILNSRSNSLYSITPKRQKRSISYAPSAGATVTNEYDNIMYYENGILMGRTDKFNINGVIAFCADHSKTAPGSGVKVTGIRVETNSNIRKILYYGFSGPKQISGWDPDGLRAATSMAISQVRNGDGMNLGKRLLNQVQGLAEPPDEFTAYILTLNGSQYQQMAMWELKQAPKKGKLKVQKKSSNEIFSNGNNNYNLAGAQFGVYTDAAATKQVGILTTGADGWSNEMEVDQGTYYIKELVAPKGFHIFTNVVSVNVVANQTASTVVSNIPKTDPIGIIVKKVDSRTGQATSALAGAEFTVKYYRGDWSATVNPADYGGTPDRTWVLATDEDGFIYLADSFKVSGDEFYRNANGTPTLPLGVITIQETKAPDGYRINSQVFTIKIQENSGGTVSTTNIPTVQEDSVNFQLRKVQKYSDIGLPGVKFNYTNSDGQVSELTTDNNGNINIYGLKQGIHKIVETNLIPGYILNGNEFVFEVTADNRVVAKTDLNGKDMVFDNKSGADGFLTVSNMVKDYKLKVIKVDKETYKNLAGAEFTLYSDSALRNQIATKVTNDQGEAIFEGLVPGQRYYIKETKTPDGYRTLVTGAKEVYIDSTPVQDFFEYTVDGTKHTASNGAILVEGNKDDRVVGLIYENETVDLSLMKDQLNTGIALQGVKFKHTSPDGTETEVVTDANGEIHLKGLKRGNHKLVEIETISGYIINDNEFLFRVTDDNRIEPLANSVTNMHYQDRNGDGYLAVGNLPALYNFRITKINNHGQVLEGAEFTLYSDASAQNVVQTVVTDTQGVATFTNLVPGTKYYYKETNAPEGYRIPLNADGSEIVTEIYATSIPVQDKFSLFVNGIEYNSSTQDGNIIIEGDKANRVAGIKVVNDVLMKLPETGSNMMIPLLLIGSFLMLSYICLSIKSKKKFKFNGGN